jgi:hypothetical protein
MTPDLSPEGLKRLLQRMRLGGWGTAAMVIEALAKERDAEKSLKHRYMGEGISALDRTGKAEARVAELERERNNASVAQSMMAESDIALKTFMIWEHEAGYSKPNRMRRDAFFAGWRASLSKPSVVAGEGADHVRRQLDWLEGGFRTYDPDPADEHGAIYLVCPDGLSVNFSGHAMSGVDAKRLDWMTTTLNAALTGAQSQ